MRHLSGFRFIVALLVGFACAYLAQEGIAEVQGPPAPAQRSAGEPHHFVSLQGRFTISLPKQVSAFSPISADLPEGRITGHRFSWRTDAGWFEVGYADLPGTLASPALFDRNRDNRLALNRKAKLAGERVISLSGYAGREFKLESPDGLAIVRTYLAGSRLYEVSVNIAGTSNENEAAVLKVLDSLKLLSPAEADSEQQRQVADATPGPLPQEPAAPKLKSDAEDEGLRGRVKVVFSETADLKEVDGTLVEGKREPASAEYFNEKGNLLKRVSYDWAGNPRDITVFGYIDGERAAKYGSMRYEYDPPAPMAPPSPPGQPKPPSDPRYTHKYSYRYENGSLIEKLVYGSSGKLISRYVYSVKGNQREELFYTVDGTLDRKLMSVLDEKGNKVEETIFGRDGSVRDRYSYTYEYESSGNWTKRVRAKWVTKGGKSYFEPSGVTYRTITYY